MADGDTARRSSQPPQRPASARRQPHHNHATTTPLLYHVKRILGTAALATLTVAIFAVTFAQSAVHQLRTDTLVRWRRLPAQLHHTVLQSVWWPVWRAGLVWRTRCEVQWVALKGAVEQRVRASTPVKLLLAMHAKARLLWTMLTARMMAHGDDEEGDEGEQPQRRGSLRLTEMLYSVLAMLIVCAMVAVRCVAVCATQLWHMASSAARDSQVDGSSVPPRRAPRSRRGHGSFYGNTARRSTSQSSTAAAAAGHGLQDDGGRSSGSVNAADSSNTWHGRMARHSARLTMPIAVAVSLQPPPAHHASTVARDAADTGESDCFAASGDDASQVHGGKRRRDDDDPLSTLAQSSTARQHTDTTTSETPFRSSSAKAPAISPVRRRPQPQTRPSLRDIFANLDAHGGPPDIGGIGAGVDGGAVQ